MIQMDRKYKTVLTIAGFDGGGGAGIQADLKTFAALGCYGLSVLTALPIQNTRGVSKIYSIDSKCISDQLHTILEDFEIDAIKIGMLHTRETIECVSETLRSLRCPPIVLDPVLIAKSKDPLLEDNALGAMIRFLSPLATILTPNLDEASTILGKNINTKEEMEGAAVKLSQLGPKAVVVKGGHFIHPTCDDCLYCPSIDKEFQWFSSQRIATKNLHGTGCTFSSALAAFLAHGYGIVEATRLAKQYLFKAIKEGACFQLGHGQGPLHHFFEHWDSSAAINSFG